MNKTYRWLILGVLSCALLIVVIDVTVLYLALPALVRDLSASPTEKLWIVNMYAVTIAGLLPAMGALGDRYGFKGIFILGLVIFGVSSLAAAFSPVPSILIAARAVQAIGAAMMMPATLGLIRQVFDDPDERSIAIGIWAAIAAGGAALGPIVGGILLEHFWWGVVFLINVPIAVIAMVLAGWLIPPGRRNLQRPFDLLAAGQSMLALVGFTFAIKEASSDHSSLMVSIVALGVSVMAGVAFFRRQQRSSMPMIDFSLFRDAGFSAAALSALAATMVLMGVELAISQQFQLIQELSPLEAGIAILPIPLAAFISGPAAGLLIPRLGVHRMLVLSMAISAIGLLVYVLYLPVGQWLQSVTLALFGLGLGATMTAASNAMLMSVPASRAGMAASMEETVFEMGGAMGVTLLGSLMSALYTSSMQGKPGVPLQAQESIDGARALADALPGTGNSGLMAQASAAFNSACEAALTVSAAILIVLPMLLVVLAWRRRGARRGYA